MLSFIDSSDAAPAPSARGEGESIAPRCWPSRPAGHRLPVAGCALWAEVALAHRAGAEPRPDHRFGGFELNKTNQYRPRHWRIS